MTLYCDTKDHIWACSTKVKDWIAALRRCKYPGPMVREMARAKIGGYRGYSLPFLDFPDSKLEQWQTALDGLLRDKERATEFASTSQFSAPADHGGTGGLNLAALRASSTLRVTYGALNATARQGGAPSTLAAQLRSHLASWHTANGFLLCPLMDPLTPLVSVGDTARQAPTSIWTRVHKALALTDTILVDSTARPPDGRPYDIPIDRVGELLLRTRDGPSLEDTAFRAAVTKEFPYIR